MTVVGDVYLMPRIDSTKGTVAIAQDKYTTESLLERYNMANYNPAYTSGVGKKL